jgi:hypothetical protein
VLRHGLMIYDALDAWAKRQGEARRWLRSMTAA